MEIQQRKVWSDDAPQQALRQVADLFNKAVAIDLKFATDGMSFSLVPRSGTQPHGILSVVGRIGDDDIIIVKAELFRGPEDVRVFARTFCRKLSKLGDKIRLCPPPDKSAEDGSIWSEFKVKAEPISLTRAEPLLAELKSLNQLARLLQSELPAAQSDSAIEKLYTDLAGTLAPVLPWNETAIADGSERLTFGHQAWDYLDGGSSIAIAAPFPIQRDVALALLARAAPQAQSHPGTVDAAVDQCPRSSRTFAQGAGPGCSFCFKH